MAEAKFLLERHTSVERETHEAGHAPHRRRSTGPTGPTGLEGGGALGPTGPAGADGRAGATGPTGPAGVNGSPGATGPAGLVGVNGSPGATGPAGPVGPTGPAGMVGTGTELVPVIAAAKVDGVAGTFSIEVGFSLLDRVPVPILAGAYTLTLRNPPAVLDQIVPVVTPHGPGQLEAVVSVLPPGDIRVDLFDSTGARVDGTFSIVVYSVPVVT